MKTFTAAALLATAGIFTLSGCATSGNLCSMCRQALIKATTVNRSLKSTIALSAMSMRRKSSNRACRHQESASVSLLDAGVSRLILALAWVEVTIVKRVMRSYRVYTVKPTLSFKRHV